MSGAAVERGHQPAANAQRREVKTELTTRRGRGVAGRSQVPVPDPSRPLWATVGSDESKEFTRTGLQYDDPKETFSPDSFPLPLVV